MVFELIMYAHFYHIFKYSLKVLITLPIYTFSQQSNRNRITHTPEYSPQNDVRWRSCARCACRWLCAGRAKRRAPGRAAGGREHHPGRDGSTERWCTSAAAGRRTSMARCSRWGRPGRATAPPAWRCPPCWGWCASGTRAPSAGREWPPSRGPHPTWPGRTPRRWCPPDRWTTGRRRWRGRRGTLACAPLECRVSRRCWPEKCIVKRLNIVILSHFSFAICVLCTLCPVPHLIY